MIHHLSFLRCCSPRSLGSVATWRLLCSLDPRSTHCFVRMLGLESRSSVPHRRAVASGSPFHAHSLWDPNVLQPLPHPWKVFLKMSEVWVSCRLFFFFSSSLCWVEEFPWWLSSKESTCQCRRHRRSRFDLWVAKIPWRRKRQPTPVFLPGESHGQRSLADYSPRGCKSQTRLSAHTRTHTHTHTLIWSVWVF